MVNYIIAFLSALGLGLLLTFPVIHLCKKLKISQTILHYVDKHTAKSGTPTMGGWIFILAGMAVSLIFIFDGDFFVPLIVLLVMLGYGLLGFLDDYIKIKFHQNEGLRPYQKIIGQVGISLIVALYTYFKVGTSIDLFGLKIELGLFIIPFIILFFVAVTNAVNLTDGLDGLAGGVSGVYLLFFGIILALLSEFDSLALICFAFVGAILAFLCVNSFPAKIFMGDTGSLALGGLIAGIAVFSGLELIMPIIGIMFVMSVLSDILQVAHYKRTKRRIFKMAPLHHHFEKLGVHENRIVTIYIVITLVCGLCCTLGYMFVAGVI